MTSLNDSDERNDIEILKNSEYFDAEFYLSKYKDLKNVDPYKHYLKNGFKEGRLPSLKFDPQKYINNKKLDPSINPIIDYEKTKNKIDTKVYPTDYLIVKQSIYFDESFYKEIYSDIKENDIDPVEHYANCGYKEGRLPSLKMDVKKYYRTNKITDKNINPVVHYEEIGVYNGAIVEPTDDYSIIQNSHLFDNEYYNQTYTERKIKDCITDFLIFGNIEEKDPSPYFITKIYLDFYDDVKNSRYNALVHYIKYGLSSKDENKRRLIANKNYPDIDYLIISNVNDTDGVYYWRVKFKKEYLEKKGYKVETELLNNLSTQFLSKFYKAKNIVIVRPNISNILNLKIKFIAKEYNKKLITDIDDLDLPETAKFNGKFLSKLINLNSVQNVYTNEFLSFVDNDQIIVSTNYIKENFQAKFKKQIIKILPNLIPSDYCNLSKKFFKDDAKIKLGYVSGTITHDYDFSTIILPFINFLIKHENVELIILGNTSIAKFIQDIFKERIQVFERTTFDEMFNIYKKIDLVIVPLAENPFNQGKSAIKFIEAGAVGTPILAKSTLEFEKYITDNVNGYLYDTPDNFIKKLEEIIKYPNKKIAKIGINAFEYVKEKCTTDNY